MNTGNKHNFLLRMSDIIDIDCGPAIAGEKSIEEMGENKSRNTVSRLPMEKLHPKLYCWVRMILFHGKETSVYNKIAKQAVKQSIQSLTGLICQAGQD